MDSVSPWIFTEDTAFNVCTLAKYSFGVYKWDPTLYHSPEEIDRRGLRVIRLKFFHITCQSLRCYFIESSETFNGIMAYFKSQGWKEEMKREVNMPNEVATTLHLEVKSFR